MVLLKLLKFFDFMSLLQLHREFLMGKHVVLFTKIDFLSVSIQTSERATETGGVINGEVRTAHTQQFHPQ